MTIQETINGVTYNVKAEVKLTGKAAEGNYKTILLLVRPNGNKEFMAMRDLKSNVTLN